VVIVSAGATLRATLAADWTATQACINGGAANLTVAGFDVNLQQAPGLSGSNVSNAGDPNAVRLMGSLRSDTLTGGEGDDWLNPLGTYGGGREVLDGGAGADTRIGTHGSRLTGGSGADIFVFSSVYSMHSSVITDFNAAEGDILDLRSVDADSWEEERQPLVFIGSQSFTMVEVIDGETFPYHIRYAMRFEDGRLQFDLDADGVAEYQTQLLGVTTIGDGLRIW
jgi:ABC-type transport system substrate-binding protein